MRALHSSLDTFVQANSQIERLCKDFGFSPSDFQLVSSSASELQELRSFVVESDISRIEENTVSEALAKLTEDESLLTRALECRDALFAIIPGKPSRRQALACKRLLSKRAMLSDLQLFIKETGLAEAIAGVSRGVSFYQRAQEIIAKGVVPEPSYISKLHATLADGGVLSFLKSGVRRAKRDALSLLVGLPEKASTTVVMAKLEEALELAKELNRLPVSSHLDAFKEGSSQLFKDARASLMELQEVSAAAMLSPEQVIILCGSSVLAAVEELDSKGVNEDLTWEDIEAKRAQIERQREGLQGIAEALERAIQVAVALGKRSATEVLSLAKLSQEASTLSSQRQASLESLDPQIKVEDARGLLDGVSQYSDLSASSKKVIFEEDRKEVLETVSANLSLFAAIEGHFKTLSREKSGAEDEASELGINDMMRVLTEHHNDQQGLRCLLARQSIYEESVAIGCAELVKKLDSYKGPLATEDLIVGVCVANLKRVVEQAHGATLLEFDGTSLDVARLQLQQLDRQLISRSSAAIDSEALSRANPPEGIARGRKSEYTEMSLIYHELQKSRRLPPRKVVERARGALLELFPCWMMVPTAVPQYLPRKELFDLIIIDEASQMTPENSISALMRGRTALIAGDTNQLPPTSFFKGVGGEEEDDEDISISEESILELANIQFRPKHRLLWHYRSRHEDLIAFSNHYVYDSELVIFPSPTPTTSGLGISLVEVKGVFQRGINPEEAQVMVDAIAQFMRDQPDRSLGVAVMNQSQMEQIDALILRESEINQAVANYLEHWSSTKEGLERFFVKNLENVQGDERDVIFVGTVYGKDPEGKFYQRFGPINGAAGKRRLNVLFSRAKEQIVTFSSIPLSDFSPAEHNEGATLLKRWLEFSATKRLGEVVGVTNRAGYPESPFEEHVIETIESLGYEAIPQVGVSSYFIDVGVKHSSYPYGYICGVECDGATYHSSKSARDRDRLREEVLKRLGWDLYRVWSTDWFRDTLSERDHLKRYLDERLASLTQDASLSSEVVAG